MKKILIAVAVTGLISVAGSVDAQSPAPEAAPVVIATPDVIASPVVQDTPVYTQTRSVRSSKRGGPLSNLMELERRKNAWLRSTFFGR